MHWSLKIFSHWNTFSPFLTEYFLYSYLFFFFFTFFLYFFPTFLPTYILIFIKFVEGIANLEWLTLEMKVYQIGSIHIFFFTTTLSKKYILCLWFIFHRHKCTNEANKSWNNSALATLNIYCVLFYYIFFCILHLIYTDTHRYIYFPIQWWITFAISKSPTVDHFMTDL